MYIGCTSAVHRHRHDLLILIIVVIMSALRGRGVWQGIDGDITAAGHPVPHAPCQPPALRQPALWLTSGLIARFGDGCRRSRAEGDALGIGRVVEPRSERGERPAQRLLRRWVDRVTP